MGRVIHPAAVLSAFILVVGQQAVHVESADQKAKRLDRLREGEHLKLYGDFLRKLKATSEGEATLLDRTIVLGSHMHSGGHDNRNLPIILAGGGFKHGQHFAFDQTDNTRRANLRVSMLQRLGLDADRFATSTGTLNGLELSS